MITHKQYIQNASELHQDYYLQFVSPSMRSSVDRLKVRILKSKDTHLNDIELSTWDHIARFEFQSLANINLKINGSRSASLSDGVCAAKAYAKTLIEKEHAK